MRDVDRAARPPEESRFDFLLAALAYAAVCLACVAYVPMWDGGVYAECLANGLSGRRGYTLLDCANHPTVGYLGLLALPLRLAGLRFGAVIAANVLLGALAVHAAADLAALMFPGREHRVERAVTALAVALNPLLAACTLQLTPDFGIAVFSLCTLRALARGRVGAAIAFGALGCFSKETGVAIYAVSCAAYLLVYVTWADAPRAQRLQALRRHAALALPLALFVAFVALRSLRYGRGGVWQGGGSQTSLWRHLLTVSWVDEILPSQLAQIFVLNFGWVLAAFVLLAALRGAALGLWSWAMGDPAARPATDDARARLFVALAFVGSVVMVTRFRTWLLPRYMLPAVLLLPLVALSSLHALGVRPRLRALLLAIQVVLSAASLHRTRDGLTMQVFDSFLFGDHRLVDLGSRTHERSHRDHIVYNLEFTQLARLLDEVLPFVLADPQYAVATTEEGRWYIFGPVDPVTHRRVLPSRGAMTVSVWALPRLRAATERPARVYYIELPGMDDEDELILWSRYYRAVQSRVFTRDGYTVTVRELRLRDDAPTGVEP